MRRVADSFTWPFRGRWRSRWLAGAVLVLFLPLTFIPVLGYAIDAVRAAERDPEQGPPSWNWSRRLLWDGAWTALSILALTAPFAFAWWWLIRTVSASPQAAVTVDTLLLIGLALPWGLVLMVLMPCCSARFAETGRPNDLFDFADAIRGVVHDFAAWNATAAAMVTAWAIGFASAGLLCVGAGPGVFYAILVSAHAAAAYRRPRPTSSAR